MTKYNEFVIESNDSGEHFYAHVTNNGVYLHHNWYEGGLFIDHDTFEELDVFRQEFLEEI